MESIRLFVDIARLRSVSAAAEKHGVSQSAASQRMATLERQLGVALFDRTSRPITVTAAGRAFLAGAIEALAAYDRAEAEARTAASLERGSVVPASPAGEVRVAAIYSAGMEWLAGLVEAFERRRPGVSVSLEYTRPDGVYAAVVEGRADLGLVSFPDRFPSLRAVPLREEPMGLVVSRAPSVLPQALALAGRGRVRPADLSEVPLVGFDASLPIARKTDRYLRSHGVEPAYEHRFDNMDSVRSAVQATGLPAILPLRCVEREVRAGAVFALPLDPPFVRPVAALVPRTALSAAARSLLEELKKTDLPAPAPGP